MFKYKSSIEEVESITSNKNHLIYYLKDGTVYLDDQFLYKGNKSYGRVFKNHYFSYGDSEESYLVDFDTKNKRQIPRSTCGETISNIGLAFSKNIIFDKQLQNFKQDFYYLNFETQEEKLVIPGEVGVFLLQYNDTQCVFRSLNILKLYDLLTGECYWNIDLGERKYFDVIQDKEVEVSIIRLIGIEENQLIVFMSNKELISIDMKTGKILWETKDFIKNNLPAYKDYRMVNSIFYYGILESGRLYQLQGNNYYSMDLHTQDVDILWEDKSDTEYLTCQYSSYTEDYVYFTGSRNNRFSPYLIGAFNRKTLQLDWLHQPEGIVNPLTNAPHYVDGKLYVVDSGRVMHVYEKE